MSEADQRLVHLHAAISRGIEDWNRVVPQLVDCKIVPIEVHEVAELLRIQDGFLADETAFPPEPGPFKCLAAFVVAALASQVFSFTDRSSSSDASNEQAVWAPRAVVWMIPYILGSLELNCTDTEILWSAFPTPHSKLETMAYLRNLATSFQLSADVGKQSLQERTTVLALIFEAVYYASSIPANRNGIRGQTQECLDQANLAENSLLSIDLFFDDMEFYENAFGGLG